MANKDPRVDAYIDRAAEFAKPILNHIRDLVHQGCPAVEETLKWSMPAFTHKGLLCVMAAFKQHATFNLWKRRLVIGQAAKHGAMGQFGRITSLKDLPPDEVLLGYIRKAAQLNESGVKSPPCARRKPALERRLAIPDYLAAALRRNRPARVNFENFSYSHKREYVEWLTGAKKEETRQRRLDTALAWMAQGKSQNWKYMRR